MLAIETLLVQPLERHVSRWRRRAAVRFVSGSRTGQIYLNDGYAMVVVTSILFGAYHWWTGIGNIIEAVLIGVLLMLFYRRSAALWPVVFGHYVTDIVDFAL